jgi:hypothetical protein
VRKNPNVVDVETAGRLLGIGRTAAYQRAREGTLPGLLPISGRHLVSLFVLEDVMGVERGTWTRPVQVTGPEANSSDSGEAA